MPVEGKNGPYAGYAAETRKRVDTSLCKDCGVDTRYMGFVNRIPAGLDWFDCYQCGGCVPYIDDWTPENEDAYDKQLEDQIKETDSDPRFKFAKYFRLIVRHFEDFGHMNPPGDDSYHLLEQLLEDHEQYIKGESWRYIA